MTNHSIIHVEARLKYKLSDKERDDLQVLILSWIKNEFDTIMLFNDSDNILNPSPAFRGTIEYLRLDSSESIVKVSECNVILHLYELYQENASDSDESEGSLIHRMRLPSLQCENLWESLIFEENLKFRLLKYAETSLLFAQHEVDTRLISWNKVILLHGPPGTGKTSLCKALAHKLAIRMSNSSNVVGNYLIEINANTIFSKWFAESSKKLTKVFDQIIDIACQGMLIFVLIDEIESLAAIRNAAGNEPSDAIRVVNCLLTQIDKIKQFPNVLIMTTSNLLTAIDLAFVDRADIKIFVGPPTIVAIYKIITSCLNELMAKGLLAAKFEFLDSNKVVMFDKAMEHETLTEVWNIAQKCYGKSGRLLRKLPLLVFSQARYVPMEVTEYLATLDDIIVQQIDREK